jgi:glycosyltransferase involved in cell wall biosynthesis
MPMLEPEPVEPVEIVADGSLDPPVDGRFLKREPTTFHGWTVFRSGPATRVELWLGEKPLGTARLGVPRPDVSRALELSPGEAPGFELTANLERWPGEDGEASLRAVATSVAGERLGIGPLPLKVLSAGKARRTRSPSERTPYATGKAGLRTLVVTHQLDLGGAQLYLMDLLRELLRIEAVNPTVVSARDGQLREELEDLGIPVHVSGMAATQSLSAHLGRVEELAAWAADREFEVAFVNTATSLAIPGVEVARRLGIPAIWAIHESFEPSELWHGVDPAVRDRAEGALVGVAQTLFVAEATQRLFEPLASRGLTIPYGLDLKPVDDRRARFDRGAARRAAGIPLDAEVVLCVGSIEPRKAQLPLAQAFDLLAARHPSARLVFVGGRGDVYSHFLADYIASSDAAERISIVPMTPEVQPWFGLSDLVVCPSDIESMPRTVLEAMAWETPVLATGVFGLPELIEDGESGWLCEPRDLSALTVALERALASSPDERQRIGRAGRALVESRHSLQNYGREIAALLDRIAREPRSASLVNAVSR